MTFVSTFLGSFYSADIYCEQRRKQGNGFAYSLMLVLLTLCISSIVYAPMLNDVHRKVFVGEGGKLALMDDVLNQIAEQTPLMTYENKTLATQEPGPHVIHLKLEMDGKTEEVDAITIDTTGATTYSNMKTPLLVTANEIVSKQESKTEIKAFKELDSQPSREKQIITPEYARDMAADVSELVKQNLSKFYLIGGAVILIVMAAILYVARIVMLLALALGGMLLASILRTKAPFDMLMRLAAVSFTPVTILAALAPCIGSKTPGVWTLYALGLLMLAAALYSSREEGAAA